MDFNLFLDYRLVVEIGFEFMRLYFYDFLIVFYEYYDIVIWCEFLCVIEVFGKFYFLKVFFYLY